MAEISPKRHREDESNEEYSVSISSNLDGSNSKRQKPYDTILNLLDEEEPEPSYEPSHELSQDLSAIFTTFEQELSSSSSTATFDFESLPSPAEVETVDRFQLASADGGDEDRSTKSVMRHLLEASDDELGIPNARDDNGVGNLNSGENLPSAFTDDIGLWELDDVEANYYTVLQSELFM